MDSEFPPGAAQFPRAKVVPQQRGDLHLFLRNAEDHTLLLTSEYEHLRQLINHTVVGMFRSTLEGQLIMVNAALGGMLGYESPEDMLNSITDIPTQVYVDGHRREAFRRLWQDGEPVIHLISQAYRKNREILWIEEYARVWRDAQGHIRGYEGVVLALAGQPPRPEHHPGTSNELEQSQSELFALVAQLRQELTDSRHTINTLSEELDRYRTATKGSQEGLWEGRKLPDRPWDAPETPAWYSSQFLALLGFEEAEFPPVLYSWASRLHPEDRERVFKAMADHIQHPHIPYEVESRLKTKQGEYRWFKAKGQAIFDETGNLLRGGGMIRDITDQKKSQEALKAIMKGTVSPGNPNFFRILVQQLAETLGVPMICLSEYDQRFFPKVRILAFWHTDHFEDAVEYDCEKGPCEQVLKGQLVYIPEGVQAQFPENDTVKALGIEGYWGIPLVNATGEVVGNLAIMDRRLLNIHSWDVSLLQVFAARAGTEIERKRAQEELQESKERYRALYDQTPLMYFTVDPQLTVLSVNKFGADVLGYRVQELVGNSVLAVIHEEDQPHFQKAVAQSLQGGNEPFTREFRKLTKDGTLLWVKETLQTITDPQQQQILLLSCEDITHRKRAEEALARSEKQLRQTQKMEAMGTLAGGIAHDFNNILGAILGYSELALTQVSQNQKVKSYMEEVVTAGLRAKELVKQILAFSRRSDQERQAVDLKVILREALQMIRATLPTTIEIRSRLEVDSAVVFADPTQLHQVIMNLCANAEYAMRKHGGVLELLLTSVELTPTSVLDFPSLKPGMYLQLTIRDTGQGISAQVLDRIFEPFFTTKSKEEGTGLGLAVVHGVIMGHGGHIGVSSVKDEGTTFTILLPRLDVVLPGQTGQAEEWPKGTGRILYVDDEEMLAKWGDQLLTHVGYAVVATTNPHEAMDLFRKEPDQFDLIVTDQTMPAMSGEAFARELLKIRQDIPIILCTGFSYNMSAEKAAQLGLSAFLMKPVNAAELAHTVKNVLDEHKNSTKNP